MKRNRVIYRLWHNKSSAGRVGYIGKDSNYPTRLNLSNRKHEKSCTKLYRALLKYPLKIWHKDILVSDFNSEIALNKAEKFYIRKFDSKNKGYNCTDGGEGTTGLVHSEKTKKKMSKARKGKKQSPEHIVNRIESRKGWKHTEEAKEKMSISHRVENLSKATRKRISKAQKNRAPISLETRKKMSDVRRGKKHTLESRVKMSLSQMGNTNSKGVVPSIETRKKISDALKGREMSPEWCENISKGHIGLKASIKTRKKLSKIRKGKGNPNWGKHHSAETLNKISLGLKASWAKKKTNGK